MYPLIRSLLFRMDPEAAHELIVRQIEGVQQIPILMRWIESRPPVAAAPRHLLGLRFSSPIGIAAGFDKNALMMPMLAALGFGFIEVGTVTLHPQEGNPRPRLFRYPRDRALVNRLGFNNDGAEAVAQRLQRFERKLPLFVNIGKNRDVPIEAAADAYAECYRRLAPHADAVVLNLSSPNTPGLRELQRPEQLEKLVAAIPKQGPLLIKIAPDLDHGAIDEISDLCARVADGMICTNTTIEHSYGERGGLSGRPLLRRSTEVLQLVRRRVGPSFPLIGVGGVFTVEDVRAKMAAGADLVQLYTSFIYEGPSLPRRLAHGLA